MFEFNIPENIPFKRKRSRCCVSGSAPLPPQLVEHPDSERKRELSFQAGTQTKDGVTEFEEPITPSL